MKIHTGLTKFHDRMAGLFNKFMDYEMAIEAHDRTKDEERQEDEFNHNLHELEMDRGKIH